MSRGQRLLWLGAVALVATELAFILIGTPIPGAHRRIRTYIAAAILLGLGLGLYAWRGRWASLSRALGLLLLGAFAFGMIVLRWTGRSLVLGFNERHALALAALVLLVGVIVEAPGRERVVTWLGRTPPAISPRWFRAFVGVAVVWLLLLYVTFGGSTFGLHRVLGVGSYLSTCLWWPDALPTAAILCGAEDPTVGLFPVRPLAIAIFVTALALALAYLLGRPYRLLWLIGLLAWTVGLVIIGAMAPSTVVCTNAGGGSTSTCYYAWWPGWRGLGAWLLSVVLLVGAALLISRLRRAAPEQVR
jgi:hypothetical protein